MMQCKHRPVFERDSRKLTHDRNFGKTHLLNRHRYGPRNRHGGRNNNLLTDLLILEQRAAPLLGREGRYRQVQEEEEGEGEGEIEGEGEGEEK